jgi:hypothetical protein
LEEIAQSHWPWCLDHGWASGRWISCWDIESKQFIVTGTDWQAAPLGPPGSGLAREVAALRRLLYRWGSKETGLAVHDGVWVMSTSLYGSPLNFVIIHALLWGDWSGLTFRDDKGKAVLDLSSSYLEPALAEVMRRQCEAQGVPYYFEPPDPEPAPK